MMLQEFVQHVEDVARSVMEEMHTAIPAKIQLFDATKNMATVKPYGTFVTGAGKKMAYPVITGVPCIFPKCPSENIEIAFPVKTGDDCLVIISEVELDAWFSGGESDNNMRFDLTSAVAIPGLSNKSSSVLEEACNDNSIILKNGDVKLKVAKTGVEIKGNIMVEGDIMVIGEVSACKIIKHICEEVHE